MNQILTAMEQLISLFAPKCSDRTTLDELADMLGAEDRWIMAHALFDRIRRKTLAAIDRKDAAAVSQYGFEEICAKTLYNLGYNSAPFDPDSPYFVVPCALDLARQLGVDEREVIEIVRFSK